MVESDWVYKDLGSPAPPFCAAVRFLRRFSSKWEICLFRSFEAFLKQTGALTVWQAYEKG